jgi:hypothetical protein
MARSGKAAPLDKDTTERGEGVSESAGEVFVREPNERLEAPEVLRCPWRIVAPATVLGSPDGRRYTTNEIR